MAKLCNIPDEIEIPVLDFNNRVASRQAYTKFYTELRDYMEQIRPNDEYAGEIVRFSVADGFAEYMVVSISPLWLVHIPLYDGYTFEYIHRLTSSDIKKKIKQQRQIDKSFNQKLIELYDNDRKLL